MSKLVALNRQRHQSLRINREQAQETVADLHMLPVVLSEYLQLVVNFPILFSKDPDNGQFVRVVLFGFAPGENLFWQTARQYLCPFTDPPSAHLNWSGRSLWRRLRYLC